MNEDEDKADAVAVTDFEQRLARGEEELISAEFVNRMIDGENKVRVWRDFRGLTARDLAEKAGISVRPLEQIENDERLATLNEIQRLATALHIDTDDLEYEGNR